MKNKKTFDGRKELENIKMRMYSGTLTYDQAKAEAKPIIDQMNERIKEISRKHSKRPFKISFAGAMR